MNTSSFKRDETTGLWKWPVLFGNNWTKWMPESCAILLGQSRSREGIKPVVSLSLSTRWPQLQQFCLAHSNFLVLAQGYSVEQALLLAEDVNRQLHEKKTPPHPHETAVEPELTWGIAVAPKEAWNLPDALAEAFHLRAKAEEEGRFGSINIAEEGWQNNLRNEPVVCARHDGLTGLWNWQSLAALRLKSGDEPSALLMGNVDRLKVLHDNYGHQPIDDALRAIGEVLHSLESADVAAFRSGGDEFMVWARGFSLQHAQDLAQEINNRTRQIEIVVRGIENLPGALSLTWGVACASSSNAGLETMLQQADELLMTGKRECRGSVNS